MNNNCLVVDKIVCFDFIDKNTGEVVAKIGATQEFSCINCSAPIVCDWTREFKCPYCGTVYNRDETKMPTMYRR